MKQEGFTLIEVLASLLVFSVGIIGLSQAGSQSARAAAALEMKTLAGIIADNQIVIARTQPLKLGVQSGQAVMLSQNYNFRLETQKTEVDQFYRIIVTVKREGDEQTVSTRTAFRGQD